MFRWFCGNTTVRLEPFGIANINPVERDVISALEGSMGNDDVRYATGKSGGGGAGREQDRETFDTFEQARNAAMEEIGEIDESTRRAYIGTRGPGEGKVIGFETVVDKVWKRLRIDYDASKGAHIHVETKGQNLVFKWLGGREDYLKQLGVLQR